MKNKKNIRRAAKPSKAIDPSQINVPNVINNLSIRGFGAGEVGSILGMSKGRVASIKAHIARGTYAV